MKVICNKAGSTLYCNECSESKPHMSSLGCNGPGVCNYEVFLSSDYKEQKVKCINYKGEYEEACIPHHDFGVYTHWHSVFDYSLWIGYVEIRYVFDYNDRFETFYHHPLIESAYKCVASDLDVAIEYAVKLQQEAGLLPPSE